jgi:two-component system sensor histidine kinase ChvG
MPSKPFTASAIATASPERELRPGVGGGPPLAHSRFSALAQRIFLFNIVALLILIGGALAVQSTSKGLVDERLNGIQAQAAIVASTLAEYATDESRHELTLKHAEPLLRQLIEPTRLRARLYDTHGTLLLDTRDLLPRNIVQTQELPPLDFWSRAKGTLRRLYESIMGVRPIGELEPFVEEGRNGRIYHEVNSALLGTLETARRVDERNKLVLSVAVPIQRFKAIYGVLLVSTEGGDIDNILRAERVKLLQVFLVAVGVMLISSLYLSGFIAAPIRRLAAAADAVRRGRSGRESIPSITERGDEIGDLSVSLAAMTRALYDRIDAIESFAADVAHELKNPLTSLKSAIEMFARADSNEARLRLMAIVRNDVRRIDRLISDISDASRLDAELSREATEPVNLAHLLETIVEVYRMTEISRGVAISLALDLPPGAKVIGRDERLGQVFRNLIDNAISFSPPNSTVSISARMEGRLVWISVEDEGPGIPTDNLETVFKRFYTERPSEHEFGKNSGLGLSIARQIVQGMGGQVWAENRLGPVERSGARFIVELPLAQGS